MRMTSMTLRALLFILCFTSMTKLQAQKVKYKDLHALLSTSQFDLGEPLLRRFLANPKKSNHPNANMYMAVIFEEKSLDKDPLKEADQLKVLSDSAVLYFDKALKLITDKEVSKNSEYYEAYQRRDIRSGKVGVKLSDVHFDLKKRRDIVIKRRDQGAKLKEYEAKYNDISKKCADGYKKIRQGYKSKEMLLLCSNDQLLSELDGLTKDARATIEIFNDFKSTALVMPESGYAPKLNLTEVNYDQPVTQNSKLTADEVKIYDYELWAKGLNDEIKNDIEPLRTDIISFDMSLNKLYAHVQNDEEISLDDETMFSLTERLAKFDQYSLPTWIFNIKKMDLNYLSHKYKGDSLDIESRENFLKMKTKMLTKLDSVMKQMGKRNLTQDEKKFRAYIKKQYNGFSGLEMFIQDKLKFIKEEGEVVYANYEAVKQRSQWLINENDSIPLMESTDGTFISSYYPLEVESNYTIGLSQVEDKYSGYFSLVDNERKPKSFMQFPIGENILVAEDSLSRTKGIAISDDAKQIFLILVYSKTESGYSGTIAKTYIADGLAWQKDIDLAGEPEKLSLNSSTGDITVKYNSEGQQDSISPLVLSKRGDIRN